MHVDYPTYLEDVCVVLWKIGSMENKSPTPNQNGTKKLFIFLLFTHRKAVTPSPEFLFMYKTVSTFHTYFEEKWPHKHGLRARLGDIIYVETRKKALLVDLRRSKYLSTTRGCKQYQPHYITITL